MSFQILEPQPQATVTRTELTSEMVGVYRCPRISAKFCILERDFDAIGDAPQRDIVNLWNGLAAAHNSICQMENRPERSEAFLDVLNDTSQRLKHISVKAAAKARTRPKARQFPNDASQCTVTAGVIPAAEISLPSQEQQAIGDTLTDTQAKGRAGKMRTPGDFLNRRETFRRFAVDMICEALARKAPAPSKRMLADAYKKLNPDLPAMTYFKNPSDRNGPGPSDVLLLRDMTKQAIEKLKRNSAAGAAIQEAGGIISLPSGALPPPAGSGNEQDPGRQEASTASAAESLADPHVESPADGASPSNASFDAVQAMNFGPEPLPGQEEANTRNADGAAFLEAGGIISPLSGALPPPAGSGKFGGNEQDPGRQEASTASAAESLADPHVESPADGASPSKPLPGQGEANTRNADGAAFLEAGGIISPLSGALPPPAGSGKFGGNEQDPGRQEASIAAASESPADHGVESPADGASPHHASSVKEQASPLHDGSNIANGARQRKEDRDALAPRHGARAQSENEKDRRRGAFSTSPQKTISDAKRVRANAKTGNVQQAGRSRNHASAQSPASSDSDSDLDKPIMKGLSQNNLKRNLKRKRDSQLNSSTQGAKASRTNGDSEKLGPVSRTGGTETAKPLLSRTKPLLLDASAGALRPTASADALRQSYLNGMAAGNSPSGGPIKWAPGKENVGQQQLQVSRPESGVAEIKSQCQWITSAVCRAIFNTIQIKSSSELVSMGSFTDGATLTGKVNPTAAIFKFPSSALEQAKAADVQWLSSVLEKTNSPEHSVVQHSIFQEKVMAVLSSCVGKGKTRANTLGRKFAEEVKRRVPCICTACWKSIPVLVCGCGEGYCVDCCYSTDNTDNHWVCLLCRLEEGAVTPRLSLEEDKGSNPAPSSDTVVEVRADSRCLGCQRRAQAPCNVCSTPFCLECAFIVPGEQSTRARGFRCRSCMGHLAHTQELDRRIDTLCKAIEQSRARAPAEGGHGPSRSKDTQRSAAAQLSGLHVICRLHGLDSIADRILPVICKAAASELTANLKKPSLFAPEQMIYSLGRHHTASTQLLSQSLLARAAYAQSVAISSEKNASSHRKGPRASGPIRLGYMFTAAAWTSSMLACVYQWFTQYSARFAVTTVGLGDDLQALEMIKGGGCEALSILRIGDKLSDEDAYRLVCSKEFDIIVDLDCGSGARSAMKARKGIAGKVIYAVGTACLQPKGTNCDYVLGDSMTFPPETRSESVPVLKVGFSRPFSIGEALTARERDSSSKADFKLPSDGFIFMHVQEVSPASTEALNLLLSVVQGTPGSFLVMVGQTLWAQASFLEQARAFATAHNWFDPEVRVLFRPWPTSTGDRVRLMRHGDLLLANCEGGSITGAGMQALASCLPVLVCVSKKQRQGWIPFGLRRDISSALCFLGLGEELVAKDEDCFVEKGTALGNHRAKVLKIKLHLQAHAEDRTCLFSENRQIKEWEHALEKVHLLKEGDSNDADIDATLLESEFMPCPALQFLSQDLQATVIGIKRSIASAAPKDPDLEAAEQRESTVLRLAAATQVFNNPVAKAQLDSLLEDVQEHGVSLGQYAGSGGFSSVVLGTCSKAQGVSSGQPVALLFENQKAPAARVFNRALLRYAHIISSDRRRQPYNDVMVRPVRLFEKGTSSFSISYPDEQGFSIFCLVVEGVAQGFLKGLERDIQDWIESARLSERLRCDIQRTLFAVNRFHDALIVHGDIKPDNIMRTSDGEIVFIDWGGGWKFGGRTSLLERRNTSCAPGTSARLPYVRSGKCRNKLAALAQFNSPAADGRRVWTAKPPAKAPSVKELAVKKHLPRSTSRMPDGRRPWHLRDVTIRNIIQCFVEKGCDLGGQLEPAGNGSAMFRNDKLWQPGSGRMLTSVIGIKRDAFALFRTILMLYHPPGKEGRAKWIHNACAAERSREAMLKFLLNGKRLDTVPQFRAVERLADFLYKGFRDLDLRQSQTHEFITLPVHPEVIEQAIFGPGFLVIGGDMASVPGCPFPEVSMLKDVRVIVEPGKGPGLQAVEPYTNGDIVTFYLAKRRVGTEIHDDPPGRYVVAVCPRAVYGNGEFDTTRTLEWFAEKKAVGVCINAPTGPDTRNCYLQRVRMRTDSEGNIWIPVVAAKDIAAGEYLWFKYDHEAAGGNGYSFPTFSDDGGDGGGPASGSDGSSGAGGSGGGCEQGGKGSDGGSSGNIREAAGRRRRQ